MEIQFLKYVITSFKNGDSIYIMIIFIIAVAFKGWTTYTKNKIERDKIKATNNLASKKDQKIKLFETKFRSLRRSINIISSQYSDSISIQVAEVFIKRVYKHSEALLVNYIVDIILENNIEKDKPFIVNKIQNKLKDILNQIEIDLGVVKVYNIKLNEYSDCSFDIDEIIDFIENNANKSAIVSKTNDYFNSIFKLQLQKIINKLN